MAAVEIRNVTKRWDAFTAVEGISFRVSPGHLTALLGPSGCGKSTTLRLVAGLDEPNSGTIVIAGRDVTREPPAGRGISMVFQSYALFPHLSVAENILFGLKVRKAPRAERDERLRQAADMLGLSGLLDRKPSQLSGGQQQRVALGRAIVAQASVCLMDEPLSNLDAQLRVDMRREIRDLQRRLGMTMLYVTHDQVEAMTMADQVIVMQNGRIEQDASAAELYERPRTAFVARFIGTPPMNVLPLTTFLAAGGELPPSGGHDPATLSVGLRPEGIEIAETGARARVAAVEYLGADTLVETRIADSKVIVRRPGRVTAAPGEEIALRPASDAVHWFDLASGRRLD